LLKFETAARMMSRISKLCVRNIIRSATADSRFQAGVRTERATVSAYGFAKRLRLILTGWAQILFAPREPWFSINRMKDAAPAFQSFKWNSISPHEAADLFRHSGKPFWIAGGWAIDLFVGRTTRAHADLDIAIRRGDQLATRKSLSDFGFAAADPPGAGVLREVSQDEYLQKPIHNLWVNNKTDWVFEILLNDFKNGMWIYRRNAEITGPAEDFGWKHHDGFLVIAPEIQLLYKAATPRAKDTLDFETALPYLSVLAKDRLRKWIQLSSGPNHPWLKSIG
jgi:Aminoglycoside-2''-adenylyltransferase